MGGIEELEEGGVVWYATRLLGGAGAMEIESQNNNVVMVSLKPVADGTQKVVSSIDCCIVDEIGDCERSRCWLCVSYLKRKRNEAKL